MSSYPIVELTDPVEGFKAKFAGTLAELPKPPNPEGMPPDQKARPGIEVSCLQQHWFYIEAMCTSSLQCLLLQKVGDKHCYWCMLAGKQLMACMYSSAA